MKKVIIGLAVFFILIFLTIGVSIIIDNYNLKQQQEKKRLFEKQMVQLLRLAYCNSDPSYRGYYTRIFKDTVVGYRTVIENNTGPEYFFFQSIKNPSYKVKLNRNRRNDILPYENYINYFNNGCMYFASYGGSTMKRLCLDGSTKEYFKKYRDTLFYVNKVLIYKNKVAVTSMNGIYIFNMDSENLLWKYKYKIGDFYDGSSAIINNKFYFSNIHQMVNCMNLDNMQLEWQTLLINTGLLHYNQKYHELHTIRHSDKLLILPGTKKLMLMELKTGKIIWNFPWNISGFNEQPCVDVLDKFVYFTYLDEVKCMNYKTNTTLWRLNNALYQGIYKNFVIAKTKDSKHYLILDRKTGKLKSKIENPDEKSELISFVDEKYIIINNMTIYK